MNYFRGKSLTMIIASPSVPQTRDLESTSSEFTGKLFTGSNEYVSNMSLFVSTSSHGDIACCGSEWILSIFGKGSAPPLTIVDAVEIDVPSQYHAEPSSEHVNMLSGYREWNFTSQTKRKENKHQLL